MKAVLLIIVFFVFSFSASPEFTSYDARSFGVVVDSVYDNTSAFKAMAAHGGNFHFPYGTFLFKDSINLNKSRFIGSGMGYGSAFKRTVFKFQPATSRPAFYTSLDGKYYFSSGLEDLVLMPVSWADSGSGSYGLDIAAQVTLRRVFVSSFFKSNIFLHGGISGGGPYNSILEQVRSEYSKEYGILIGTGANNISLIECYAAYNGSPSYGVAPSSAGNYDGVLIKYNGDGNPGSAYQSYVPEGVRITGGNAFSNSRNGWRFETCYYCTLEPGYAEGNKAAAPSQIYLGNDLIQSFVVIGAVSGADAGVNIQSSYYRRDNTIFIGGHLKGYKNSGYEENYNLTNKKIFFGENTAQTRQTYSYFDTTSSTQIFHAYGGAKIQIGGSTNTLTYDGSNFTLPNSYFLQNGTFHGSGGGSPEGSVTASIGSTWKRTDGYPTFYVKESGTGNTGWVGK